VCHCFVRSSAVRNVSAVLALRQAVAHRREQSGVSELRRLDGLYRVFQPVIQMFAGVNRALFRESLPEVHRQIQADVLRIKRSQRAEAVAGEAGVKMLLPGVLVMLATVLIIVGPFLLNYLYFGLSI